jgi:hypothetical protein
LVYDGNMNTTNGLCELCTRSEADGFHGPSPEPFDPKWHEYMCRPQAERDRCAEALRLNPVCYGMETVRRSYGVGDALRDAKRHDPSGAMDEYLEGLARLSDALTDMATAGCAY